MDEFNETSGAALRMTEETLLVNVEHPVPLEWVPDGLIDLWSLQPRHFLLKPVETLMDPRAAEAANALFASAEAEGLPDYLILSAYRDSGLQAVLFDESPNGYVSMPGTSEHQTGLCMDISQFGRRPSLDPRHAAWLAENCWDAGFIIRYPEGREDVTGVPHEPWHLRYVGRDAALQIHEKGWTLEEWHAFRGENRE